MNRKRRKIILNRKWKNHVLDVSAKCEECGGRTFYFCIYDADFCPQCNKWLSENCDDPNCEFCADRPDTPEHALTLCNILLNDGQAYCNVSKERAIRRYTFNERYKRRRDKQLFSCKSSLPICINEKKVDYEALSSCWKKRACINRSK